MKQYILNKKTSLKESKNVEFKKIPNDKEGIAYIKQVIPKYMSAFLNTTDINKGSIFFGILDNGEIEGCSLNPDKNQNEDELQKAIDDIAKNSILPSVAPHFYSVVFHSIYNQEDKIVSNLFIIEIQVQRDTNNIYFYDKNKIALKTHSQVRAFTGLELIEFIKRRKKVIYSQKAINNLNDLFQVLDISKPLLYWINEEIPHTDSKNYLNALQLFCHGKNELTYELDFNLLQGLDNLLRISYAYPKIDGYIFEKFNTATKYFYKYIPIPNDLHKYDKLDVKFHYLKGDLNYFLSNHQDKIKYEDKLLIELTIKILEYYRVQKHFLKTNTFFKKQLTKLPRDINQTVINLLLPLMEDKLEVNCNQDIKSLKHMCQNDWFNFIKS